MKARGLTTAAVAVAGALSVTLSGCMTVHGETAVVSATSKDEAEKVLKEYVSSGNKAGREYDAKLNATIERGALGEASQAALTIDKELDKGREGAARSQAVKVNDSRFHIPQQAGWPKFFMVDTATSLRPSGDARLLLAFTRESVDERWKASFHALVDTSDLPEFAEDSDGHVKAVPNGGGKDLLVAPHELSQAYADYLSKGEGEFADGRHTSQERENRAKRGTTKLARNEWADLPASSEQYPPFGLYTKDGGAMVFFASHMHAKQTTTKGYTPGLPDRAKPLLKGDLKSSLTLSYVVQHTVRVPADKSDDQITYLYNGRGLTGAKSE